MPVRSEPHGGHRLLAEEAEALQAQLRHPLGLALAGRDVAHDVLVEPTTRRGPGHVAVGPAVLVGADALEAGVELFDVGGHEEPSLTCVSVSVLVLVLRLCGSGQPLGSTPEGCVVFRGRVPIPPVGTNVVQTWWPPARVARRWTCTPEQPREGVGLGLAEGRELGGDVLHRAVALAQLDAGQAAGADRSGRGGEAVLAQRLDEGRGASGGVGARGGQPGGIPLLERRRRGCGRSRRRQPGPRCSRGSAAPRRRASRSRPRGRCARRRTRRRRGQDARGRGAPPVGSCGTTAPCSTSASRWRRTAAGVRSRWRPSSAAVIGPSAETMCSTRERVRDSSGETCSPSFVSRGGVLRDKHHTIVT